MYGALSRRFGLPRLQRSACLPHPIYSDLIRRLGMETPVILSAVRTPIGKFQGGLSSFSAVYLGAKAVAEAIRRSGLESKLVDEALLGNVGQAGVLAQTARPTSLHG